MKISEGFPKVLEEGGVTVKIYKSVLKGKYDLFTVAYYLEGKFTKENFGKLDDAIARGKKIIENLQKGEITSAVMTLQDSSAYLAALKNLKASGVSLETATKEYAAAVQMLGGVSLLETVKFYLEKHADNIVPKTVQQVVEEFLAAKQEGRATRVRGKGKTVSERYLYDLRKKLEKVAGRFHCSIGAITADEINRFVHEMKGCKARPKKGVTDERRLKPVSGRTKNNYIQAINVLFAFAKKQKYLPKDFAAMDEVDHAEESEFDIEIYSAEEITKILASAWDDVLPVLAIGAFAGIRSAEICRLDWSEVSLEKGMIEIKKGKSKTRSRRLVPITENLAVFLKDVAQPSGPVWPHSVSVLCKSMTRVGKYSGVKWKHNALRHSFISYRVAKIKNVNEVAMEAGNSPEMIFKHYRELVTEKEADGWFGVTPETVKGAKVAMEREKGEAAAKAEAERLAKVVPMPKTVAA